MTFHPFPALLRSDYNMIHEYGQGNLSSTGREVDFTGDFVPLIPLGAKASVQWVLGDKVQESFEGSVYLSSPHLLRLVGVDEGLLSRMRILLVTNTHIPATFTQKKKDNGSPKTPRAPVAIVYLSMDQIKLISSIDVPLGQTIYLNAQADFLTLRNLGLQVRQRASVRKGEHLLLCSIESGGTENFVALSTYSAKISNTQAEQD